MDIKKNIINFINKSLQDQSDDITSLERRKRGIDQPTDYNPSIYELYNNTSTWDPIVLNINSAYPPPNAFLFGLVINDWDHTLRSRNILLRTEDLEIPFQVIESIPNWDKSAAYDEMGNEILGRFEPYAVYSKSNAQEFTLTLYYCAYARDNINAQSFWTLENIEMLEKRLQSLVFPIYVNGYAPPPKCLLNIGNIFYDLPVIVKQVNIEYQPPYDYLTGLSMNRKITLSLRVSYPAWQAISGDKIYMARSKKSAGNHIFAYKQLKNSQKIWYN